MKNFGGNNNSLLDELKNENNNKIIDINTYQSNLLLYFQYLSNQNNSPYENGGIKNKIEIVYLLSGLGPFILTTNIDILNLPFINYDFNIKSFSEFLLFIMNNSEINYNENKTKKLNQLFLEHIKIGSEILSKLDNTEGIIGWNLNSFYKLFRKNIDNLNKTKLLISLDNPNFNIDDKKKYDFFCEILTTFNFFGDKNKNIQSFFDDFLFKKWKNWKNQIALINLIITNKEITENSVFSLKNYKGSKVSQDIELKAYTSSKNHYLIDNWRNVKLVETLILISEDLIDNDISKIKNIFDWSIKNIPEILVMSLLMINIDYTKNSLMNDLIIEVLTSILFDKSPNIAFVNEIWNMNKDIVIYVLYNSWKNFPDLMNLSVIFDLSNNILKDSLLPLVDSKYHNFSVHLGLLASKRDYLHIEKWLQRNIDKYGDDFVITLLNYLTNNVIKPFQINFNSGLSVDEINKGNILEKAQLSLESLSIVLNTLNSYTNTSESDSNSKISLKVKNEILEINKIIFDIYDEIQDQNNNSKEIEEEISQLLRSMFEGKISTNNIINLLILYKSSKEKRKIELYSCLIHQLILEYKYFSEYPKDKLKLLAELFGKIINNKLLEGLIETLALNYISESIKSNNEKLYFFGITALYQIIENISCWPKYVQILLNLDKIKQNKNLYMLILRENEKIQKRYIYENSENVLKQNGKVLSIKSESKSSGFELEDNGNPNRENNINENVDRLKLKLSGTTKNFILNERNTNNINNITITNSQENNIHLEKLVDNVKYILDNNFQSDILEQAKEINKFLGNNITNMKIFSYLLVTSKIIQNKNIFYFNELFIRINSPLLYKYVLKYTINYIQALLKIKSLYMEEKLFNILKNLGYWLGLITILKNKPILAKDIDFRELITDSYKNGKLITTIPFVCKVFSFISKSKIFNLNNPWINSILCLFKEIYLKQSLNYSIKKEIYSFFDSVKIDLNSLKINIEYLNKIEREEKEDKKLDFVSSKKFHFNIDKNKLEKKVGTLNDYINNLISILNSEKNIFSNNFIIQDSENDDKELFTKINEILNKNIDSDKKHLEIKKDMIIFLSNLLYQSIIDTLSNMMDLYFSRPIASAIHLVSQDFFYEYDINKYKVALNNTIKSFLSSFSIIGFHDMLKRNIVQNLDLCFKSYNVSKETISYIKEFPHSEFINIGLEEILKFITKEAQNQMNSSEEFRKQIERRKNRNAFLINNNNNYDVKIREILPNIIRPNKEGIRNKEYKIYEKFHVNNNVLKTYEEERKMSVFLNIVYRILKEVMDKTWEGNTSIKISKYKNYELCMKNIINICNKNDFDFKINFLDDDQQFFMNYLKNVIIDSKIDKIDVINKMAIKTLDYVIISAKMNNLLLLCVYMSILRGWSKLDNEVNNQITKRIFEYDFDIDIFTLFKTEFHLLLFKFKLINIDLYQEYIMNLLNQSSVVNTTIHNLLKSLSSNYNSANYETKKNSFKRMLSHYCNAKVCDIIYLLFNSKTSILMDMAKNYDSLYKFDFNLKNSSSEDNNISDSTYKKELNSLYLFFFTKIIKLGDIYINENEQRATDDNKLENMLSENDILNCTKYICELCMNYNLGGKIKKYSYFFYPEKLALFIYYLINNMNISLITILDIVIQCFHRDYIVNQKSFNQKKYYKFFINLINLIANPSKSDKNNDSINNLILICDTLKILSPKNYPGFTLAWLDLISYHNFINNLIDSDLIEENSFKYEKYLSLLTDILSYINQIKTQIIKHYYYKYILDQIYKFFYLLVNAYPNFIASYYYLLISCLSLSTNQEDEEMNLFNQLKNIILSVSITQKNFFNINFLNEKLLRDSSIPNKIVYLITDSLDEQKNPQKEDLLLKILVNKYFNEKDDENILDEILEILDDIKDENELNYVYNGLAVYMVQNQILKNKNNFNKKIMYNFYMFLLCNLNEVHKKHLIDSMLNLLQFSCSPTKEFSSLFQDLLFNIENEDIEKQLIINFLERIVYDPYPWGIIYTLNLLMENDKFKNVAKLYLKYNKELENNLKKCMDTIKMNEIHEKI